MRLDRMGRGPHLVAMRPTHHVLSLLLLASCGRALDRGEPIASTQGLVVHEWGTYTSVQGSNGASMDGMQHEEEALPDFVQSRADPSLGEKGIEALPGEVNQKLETPVLYFYAPRAMEVEATVDFPGGIVSQWYPQASASSPAIGSMTAIANGRMSWKASLRPGDDLTRMRPVPAESVWAPSRNVAAVPLEVAGEVERFIFYRGLGHFEVPFRVEARPDGLLDLINDSDEPIGDAFLLRVHAAGGAVVPLGRIEAHGALRGVVPPVAGKERELETYVDDAMSTVAAALERSGLYHDEARAMVETWSRSYFRGAGLRVLYVTPRAWTDRLLPLAVSPAPSAVVRTLVGRVEVMTRAEESEVLARVASGTALDAVSALGRFAEPKLRRARQLTSDPMTLARIDAALAIAREQR